MSGVLFVAAEGPIAAVSNTSLKDFIGKTLGHIKQICFPGCGLSNVTNNELMTISRRTHTVWRCTSPHWMFLKFVAFRIHVNWVVSRVTAYWFLSFRRNQSSSSFIHSFKSLSHNRSKASSKASSPHSAI
jgi:hypothetical protein